MTLATFILAHGAGAGPKSAWMVRYSRALKKRGVRVVTFEFPKTRSQMNVLEDAYRKVVEKTHARFPNDPLSIGGKSMGGRVASQIAAKYTLPIESLVFYGYPLHPPNAPDKRRDAHLPDVKAPMLFISGTRDPFATADEMRALVTSLPRARLVAIEGGDHSLVVPKRALEKQRDVDARIWDVTVEALCQKK